MRERYPCNGEGFERRLGGAKESPNRDSSSVLVCTNQVCKNTLVFLMYIVLYSLIVFLIHRGFLSKKETCVENNGVGGFPVTTALGNPVTSCPMVTNGDATPIKHGDIDKPRELC